MEARPGRIVRLALVQSRSALGTETFDPRDDNLERALIAIDAAADDRAQLIVFGEIYLQGYGTEEWLHLWATTVSPADRHVRALCDIARKRNVHVVLGAVTYEADRGDIYNSAILIGPDGVIGTYRKCHLASMFRGGRVSSERSFYSPGTDLPVFDTALGRLGVNICYDATFPEVSRVQALKGAELIINVTASADGRQEAHRHLHFVRATENACWYAVCSVVGQQREHKLYGGSRIVDPNGNFVAEAKSNVEDMVIADVDLDLTVRTRAAIHTFGMRKPELYRAISDPTPHR